MTENDGRGRHFSNELSRSHDSRSDVSPLSPAITTCVQILYNTVNELLYTVQSVL